MHYREDAGFARKVLDRAEVYYRSLADRIGVTRRAGFWLWDKRVKLYIHRSREAFVAATGAPAWAEGRACYLDHSVSTFSGCDGFLTGVLPHELAHLIFRDSVGFSNEIPLWLDEGVAQWAESDSGSTSHDEVRRIQSRGEGWSLSALTAVQSTGILDEKQARAFYAQAASLVSFLVTAYGQESFHRFCLRIRDGRSLDEALRFTYPEQVRNINELETAWRKGLQASAIPPDAQKR